MIYENGDGMTASAMYGALVRTLDNIKLDFKRDDENLRVKFLVTGEDLHMSFLVAVDRNLMMMNITSDLPFTVKNKAAIIEAVCKINNKIVLGGFIFDETDDTVKFRESVYFNGSVLDEDAIAKAIVICEQTVSKYNDKLYEISAGLRKPDKLD